MREPNAKRLLLILWVFRTVLFPLGGKWPFCIFRKNTPGRWHCRDCLWSGLQPPKQSERHYLCRKRLVQPSWMHSFLWVKCRSLCFFVLCKKSSMKYGQYRCYCYSSFWVAGFHFCLSSYVNLWILSRILQIKRRLNIGKIRKHSSGTQWKSLKDIYLFKEHELNVCSEIMQSLLTTPRG